MKHLIYCYDAYCVWCYGLSKVMQEVSQTYRKQLPFEVLSGGMVISDPPKHISATASYFDESYKQVEAVSGARFGSDYLWHIHNPQESDWFPDSRKPAIAMCIFKEMFPGMQTAFANDLQDALFAEGRDLCDNEAYRHLLDKYHINHDEFYGKLSSKQYLDKAEEEFALLRKLHIKAFPVLLLQVSETKFHLITKGYSDFETIVKRIDQALLVENVPEVKRDV